MSVFTPGRPCIRDSEYRFIQNVLKDTAERRDPYAQTNSRSKSAEYLSFWQ